MRQPLCEAAVQPLIGWPGGSTQSLRRPEGASCQCIDWNGTQTATGARIYQCDLPGGPVVTDTSATGNSGSARKVRGYGRNCKIGNEIGGNVFVNRQH